MSSNKRIILHIDMDAFFAAIEERENPRFKGRPVVVGADPKVGRGRGVVSTANYEARKYGIHSALPISQAWRKCPQAVFLPVNMGLYERVSESIMEIVKKYSSIREQVSLDEAYLDLSHIFHDREKHGINEVWKKTENLAKKLKKEILEKEKLACTIGIGPNKLIAKMAANQAKPDGLLVITQKKIKNFLRLLDIEKLPGIGPKTAEVLRKKNVNKINELQLLSRKELKEMFGRVGESIYEKARGADNTPVSSEEIIKSIGKEHTFEKDTRDPEILLNTFEKLFDEVGRELFSAEFLAKTIIVVCRFQGFETHTKSETLKEPSKDLVFLKKEAKRLLLRFLVENQKPIRLLGIRIKVETTKA